MLSTRPLPPRSSFPALTRTGVHALQANLGYRCNQRCAHCHVAAGPHRKEMMPPDVIADVVRFLIVRRIRVLDLTGGSPELHPGFRGLVERARSFGTEVVDRCNLTVLEEPGQEDLAEFLAAQRVRIIASLPCYEEATVDQQRGPGTHAKSIRALRTLNALGYGSERDLSLDLVYNAAGPSLPPPQEALERQYKDVLGERYGITFNRLLTIANMPIARFGSALARTGWFHDYLELLKSAHRVENEGAVMCLRTLSVDWQGQVFDCDFNQALGIPLQLSGGAAPRLRDLLAAHLDGLPIQVADHCYGCTAGQGSSCFGALTRTAGARARDEKGIAMKLGVSRRLTLATAAALALALITYAAVPAVRTSVNAAVGILLTTDTQRAIEGFRDYLRQYGSLAPVVSATLMVLQSVVAPLPAFVITFTNGLLFGWAWGAALSWSSAMLGAALCFGIARALGRPAVEKLVGGTKALEVSDLFFRRYGKRAVLISRLLPFVSFDLVSYGAGLTPTPFIPFLVATGIGQLPATLLYSYLGQNLAGSARVLFWVFSVTLAIAVFAWTLGPAFLRRLKAGRREPAAEAK